MNGKSEGISGRALAFLEKLVTEIGPRPAGSPAERAAHEMIAGLLEGKSYLLRRLEAPFRPKTPFFPENFLVALGLAAAANGLAEGYAWLSPLMALLILVLPDLTWWIRRSMAPGDKMSSNLFALPEKSEVGELDLILAAHVDTAQAKPRSGELWRQWRDQYFKTTLRVAFILTLLAVMQWMGLLLPPAVLLAAQIITRLLLAVAFVQDAWEQLGSRGKYAPGANDNGSGVAVIAALAEHYGSHPPEKLKIGYLFSGAEECGLFGARQFAAYLREKGCSAVVLSVDMVGAGDGLKAVSGGGTILRYSTDSELLELLERADPAIERLHYDRRSGDFEAFHRAGIRAAGIEGNGTRRSWRAYHSVDDDLDIIDPGMLEHTVGMLLQLVWLMDKSKKIN